GLSDAIAVGFPHDSPMFAPSGTMVRSDAPYPTASATCSGVNVVGPQHPPPPSDVPPQQPPLSFKRADAGRTPDHCPDRAISAYPSRTLSRNWSPDAAVVALDSRFPPPQQSGPQHPVSFEELMCKLPS